MSWSSPRKPRNSFDRAVRSAAAVLAGVAVMVGVIWVCDRAVGTPWAGVLGFAAVFSVFTCDRFTPSRNRPDRKQTHDFAEWYSRNYKDAA